MQMIDDLPLCCRSCPGEAGREKGEAGSFKRLMSGEHEISRSSG